MVRYKNILKDTLREISLNKKKFLSILLIIIIGTGFYIGLKSSPLDMQNTAKNYYKKTNLFDLKIISSTGFTNNDKFILKQLPNIKGVSLSKTLDVTTNIDNKDCNVKLVSINSNRSLNSEDYINRLTLVNGRYPSTINEGLVEENFLKDQGLSIGDLVTLKAKNDDYLRAKKIKIVGSVKSSYYSSFVETKDYFMYLEENNFNFNYYTEGFITIKNADKYDTYSKKYDEYISSYVPKINEVITKSTNNTYENNLSLLQSEITSLKDNLSKLNQTNVPSESLNDSIKEVSSELKEKEDYLEKMQNKSAYTIKRNEISGFYYYKQESKRIENISKIFAFFLTLITTLASFIFMIGMVEEKKAEIGTLRAIGYSKISIFSKFIIYAFLASILGSIIGAILFYKTVPLLIGYCYNKLYDMPVILTNFQIKPVLFATLLSCMSTLLATIIVTFDKVNKTPAELIRPQISKEGKKTNKLCSKFSFLNKVVFKNVFKHLKNSIITIISICCSTALIICMLGIKDSVMNVSDKQFKSIDKYDITVNINSNIKKENENILKNNIIKNKQVESMMLVSQSTTTLKNNKNIQNATLIIPDNANKINSFITLRNKKTKKMIKLDNKGIVISYKLAKILNVNKGDNIKITLSNNVNKNVKISQITENYIGHYVYMSSELYKELTNEKTNHTTLFIIARKSEEKLANKISKLDNVTSVQLTKNTKNNYKELMAPVNNVIIVMIVATSALLFMVLYNLESLDKSKRKKEIVSLKISGFQNEKVFNYVSKKRTMITLIGTLIGFIIGSFLTYYFVKTFETNTSMFNFKISILSYIISFVIIIALSFIANLFVYNDLKKMQMSKILKKY